MAVSAQVTISEHWPDHVMHKTVGAAPRWDQEHGIVCACGVVLGWPIEEPPEDAEPDWEPRHETLSQKLAREAQETVAAARAKADAAPKTGKNDYAKPVTGAFGTYGGKPHEDVELPEPTPGPDDGPTPVHPDEEHDGNRGPNEPEYAVGDKVTVGGIEFTKHSESPFDVPRDPTGGYDYGSAPKVEGDEAQAAYPASGDALPPWDEVDSPAEVVPYSPPVPGSGTPIYPTDAQDMDPLINRLAPLDPLVVYTPADVELKIVEILGQLEKSEIFLRQQLARLHAATHNHTMRYNLAIAKSTARSADQRKAEAVISCEHEAYEMTEADMLVKALRDSQHNLRSQLSGFQTVARSIGVSMGNTLGTSPKSRPLPEPPPEDDYWR